MPPRSNRQDPGDHPQDEDRLARLEAQLETYKKTLAGIYSLYDKKIEELSLIRRIGDSIRTPLDLEALCREIVDAVAREVAGDRLLLLVAEPERKTFRLRASHDIVEDETRFHGGKKAIRLPMDEGEAGETARTGRPLAVVSASPESMPLGRQNDPPAALLFLPLVARHKTVGLFILSRAQDQPFDDEEVRILTIISDQAATALANVQLFNDLAAANIRLQESEKQARQTSLHLERLLEAANDVIFTLDHDGRITYVNQKAAEWGYRKDDLIGRSFSDIVMDWEDGAGPGGQWPDQEAAIIEAGLVTADGERRDALVSASKIPDSPHSAVLVMARDVTGRKQLEKQLFHSEKLASIGILAAGVAHEIGNPLSAISGYAQILQSGGTTEEESAEYLSAIESQAARIGRIIEELLSYSRPSTGHRSEIDLAEAIPKVMTMLTSQRTFRQIELEYDLDPAAPPVLMDPDHLAQVLVNIGLNAAQAMEGRGRLGIRLKPSGDHAEIRLTDTGPGIPPDLVDRLFDPFFTTKKAGQGTGLGLAICHRIVETYKGTIAVENPPDGGAAFVIRLPAASLGENRKEGL